MINGREDIKVGGFDSVRFAGVTEDGKGGCDIVLSTGGIMLFEQVRLTTWCEHYGGGSSNRVALDVAGKRSSVREKS